MKKIIFITSLLLCELAIACPSCMGSMDNPKSGNITWILGGFILLTYIPFYLIYKTIIKNQNFNKQVEEIGTSEESK